jgi:hypothetical protein
MPADPMLSEGARLERRTVRNRLRRMMKEYDEKGDMRAKEFFGETVPNITFDWLYQTGFTINGF